MRESFTDALIALRKSAGLSQRGLADCCGMSRALLCRLERGERLPTRDAVDTLASYFTVERAARLYLAAGFIPESPAIRVAVGAHLLRGLPADHRIEVPKTRKRLYRIEGELTAGVALGAANERVGRGYPHYSTVYKTADGG